MIDATTADIEGEVSNSRMREISSEHPADLTQMLQGLAQKGFLHQVGQKRGTSYQLPGVPGTVSTGLLHRTKDSSHRTKDSLHRRLPQKWETRRTG